MMRQKLFKEPARVREDFCALALLENKKKSIAFSNNKQERRQNENKFF